MCIFGQHVQKISSWQPNKPITATNETHIPKMNWSVMNISKIYFLIKGRMRESPVRMLIAYRWWNSTVTIKRNNWLTNCFPSIHILALMLMAEEWKTYPSRQRVVKELPHPSSVDLAFRDSFERWSPLLS